MLFASILIGFVAHAQAANACAAVARPLTPLLWEIQATTAGEAQ